MMKALKHIFNNKKHIFNNKNKGWEEKRTLGFHEKGVKGRTEKTCMMGGMEGTLGFHRIFFFLKK